MARLVDARAPLLSLGHHAGLAFCTAYGDWRRAMVLMEDMRVAKRRPSGENVSILISVLKPNEPKGVSCGVSVPPCRYGHPSELAQTGTCV